AHEVGGDVILGRERVGRAEDDIGAAGLERDREIGGLGRDVEAGGETMAGKRLLTGEALTDLPEYGHLALRPFGAEAPLVGEGEIANVVLQIGSGRHPFSLS